MKSEVFNNREIALIFWLIIIFGYGILSTSLRSSIFGLIKVVFSKHIMKLLGLMSLYLYILVLGLQRFGLWDLSLLKDTILWFFLSGVGLVINSVTLRSEDDKIFIKIFKDNFKVIVVLEFFVSFYTFSFPVELVLLPSIVFVSAVSAVASLDIENLPVQKLANWVLTLFGIWIFWHASKEAPLHSFDVLGVAALKQFLLPFLLTLFFLPFVYLSVVYASYESLFIRIDLAQEKNKFLNRYLKNKVRQSCWVSFFKINKVSKLLSPEIWSMESPNEVDDFFKKLVF